MKRLNDFFKFPDSLFFFAMLCIILAILGCSAEADKRYEIRENLVIDLLTEFEGMKIYRVNDGDTRFYITDQRACVSYKTDQRASVSYKQPQGKTHVARVISAGNPVSFEQEGNEIIMKVRFSVRPLVEEE